MLTGEEYARIAFAELHRRLCDALRGNRAPVVAEIVLPDGTHKVVRHGRRQPKVLAGNLDLSQPIELVVLSVKEKAARCPPLGNDGILTVPAGRLWTVVPGEIESTRLDVPALGLVPLRLEKQGVWNPDEHDWGEAEAAALLKDPVPAPDRIAAAH